MNKITPFLSILISISFIGCSTKLLGQSNSYALLIGVSKYPANSDWQQLSSTNDLELMGRSLHKFGIPEKNIRYLKDSQVTKKAFFKEIQISLIDKVKPGDFAFFHFSGHGQQIPDKNGDEIDGLDEALVPINSPKLFVKGVYEGENLITDDEMAIAFNKLRKKLGPEGRLIVTLDACHSGSATRGKQTARGTNIIMADASYMASARLIQSNLLITDAELSSTDPSMAPEILFYSSSPNQLSYEYTDYNNKSYGLFSYAFCKSLSQLSSEDNYRVLGDKIRSFILSKTNIQYPYTEGKIQEKVFGKGINVLPSYFNVKKILPPDLLVLDAGIINGITKGSKVAIYDIKNSKKPIATSHVEEVSAFESDLVLETKLKKVKAQDLKAIITEVKYSELKIKLKFISEIDSLKFKIEKNLSKNPIITWSTNHEELLLELKKINKDSFNINLSNFDGELLLNNTSALNENIDYISRLLSYKITQFTQAKRLMTLETKDDFLKGKIQLLVKNDNDKFSPIVNNEIKVGQRAQLKVSNYGSEAFYFSVFEIQPDANIIKRIPEEGLTAVDCLLESGREYISEFKIDEPYGNEVLKLVCTKTPVEFGMSTTRSSNSKSSIQTLLNYLSVPSIPGNLTRGLSPVLSSNEGFIGSFIFKITE